MSLKTMTLGVLGLCFLAAGPSAAIAVPPGGLQLALDKPVTLTIEEAPIGEVFRKLSAATGVQFTIDDGVMACLPYGDQTRLTVKLRNATLRKDLVQVLSPEALQWIIEGETVRIVPSEALARMCRRASFEELVILGKLYSNKLTPAANASVIEQLRAATGDKDLDLNRQGVQCLEASKQNDKFQPGTGAEWLDRICGGGYTWYLWGDQITVLDRKAQLARQLLQQISLRYQNEKLVTVLLDLAHKARVTLALEPGVLNYVPSEVRNNFNLVMADATIQQALEVISGTTGLEFARTDDGLMVRPSEKLLKGELGVTPRRTPFVVQFTMPGPGGSNIVVFFRPEELPPEMVQQIEAEKQKILEKWQAGRATTTSAPARP